MYVCMYMYTLKMTSFLEWIIFKRQTKKITPKGVHVSYTTYTHSIHSYKHTYHTYIAYLYYIQAYRHT